MKYYILSLFATISVFAQTDAERKKISDTYDKAVINELLSKSEATYQAQKDSIAEYKRKFGLIDTETKTLHRIENGLPIFYRIFNQGSSQTINANKLYPGASLGLSVTGSGIVAGVWDSDKVRDTHIEFTGGKVILGDAATTLSPHATHVTGTIIATGISALRKGIAYGAQAKTFDWDNDYNEMLLFGSQGYLVSNHSYGYIATDLPSYKFGSYDASSIEIDNVSNASPYYQVVLAAGNDRNDFAIEHVANLGGYDILTGTCNSKNGLVVAAVNQVTTYIDPSSVEMSSFSNFGPTDDGRIKPDIAAKGVNVSSTVSSTNNSYDEFNGTSMAAPAISGLIVLLQKHYNNLNASYMRASTVRGLICHTAKEAGANPGPDYEFGWGLANGEAAANVITNRNVSTLLEENTLATGGVFTKQIMINSVQDLAVTICWTDPTGLSNGATEDSRVPRLKNNLDLKILKDGNVYYPWKLNVEDFYQQATNIEDNDVDNIEKVQIYDAQPGVYTIQVTHKSVLTGGSQVFSLIGSADVGITLNNDDYVFDNSVFIYPNPATNVLNYDVNANTEITAINIHDISGKEVYRTNNFVSNSIDIASLSSGVYFVTFQSDKNSVTKKFIKE